MIDFINLSLNYYLFILLYVYSEYDVITFSDFYDLWVMNNMMYIERFFFSMLDGIHEKSENDQQKPFNLLIKIKPR